MPPLYVIRHFISPDDIQRLSFLLWFPCRNPKRKEKKMKVPIKLAACLLAMTVMVPSGFAFADVDGEDIGGMSSGSASSIQPYANNVNTSFYFTFKKSGATSLGDEPRRKDNGTPVYVRASKMVCDRCRVYVDMWTGSKWSNVVAGTKKRATLKKINTDCSIKVNKAAAGYMVRLTGWADSQRGDVKGEWSPDSSRTYKVINGD
ncbi:hypothetical protein C811_01100 [Adlercreutzia caecimuris B7]|jgi:hypothetical protein|uniref:Uncharacterized protein n=2 Tax=Adlercreutzia caecimuris TaxID=671266 RepID=R9KWT5_9ACTN|nr:hypothetical protein C811_01100 [Adlercreutzia caecimuris B7]